jgi:hypothetical protein
MSRKEEQKEGQVLETTRRMDNRERRKGTGNQVDSKTGELEGTNTEGLYTQAVLERNVNDIASM